MPIVSVQAQQYDIAAGLRMGTDWGISYKHRIANRWTVESIMQQGFDQEVALATVMLQHHFPVGIQRLNFYTGVGGHKGWYVNQDYEQLFENPYGLSLISGVEFTLAGLILSWDIKPAVNLNDANRRAYFHSGLSARLVLKKRPSKVETYLKSDRWRFWKKKNNSKSR